jgi:peptide/nickel transport system permease protein
MASVVEREEEAKRKDEGEAPWRRLVGDFCRSRIAIFGLIVFVLILAVALLAPWISPQNPYDLNQLDIMDSRQPPGALAGDGYTFWLGSDGQGRDMLSAIFYGLRISLAVGVSSAIVAAALGTTVGLVAAYFGGRIDTLLMRIVDIKLAFPAILIALIIVAVVTPEGIQKLLVHLYVPDGTARSIAAVLGGGTVKIVFALVIVQWALYARTVRGSALVERRKEYVEAARCLGLSHNRILFRHMLPNCLPPLIVVATVQVANAIALEATLSYLGIGLPITEPSLGLLIANGYQFMLSGQYWISFFPGIALLVTIVSINLVGDQLREILNPRLQK